MSLKKSITKSPFEANDCQRGEGIPKVEKQHRLIEAVCFCCGTLKRPLRDSERSLFDKFPVWLFSLQ